MIPISTPNRVSLTTLPHRSMKLVSVSSWLKNACGVAS